jgi:hypothetical protein
MTSNPESPEAVAASLRPHLAQAEAARRSALGSTIVLGGLIALWALATSYDAWQAASFPWTVGWSALGAVGVWYVQKWSDRRWRRHVTGLIGPVIAETVGSMKFVSGEGTFDSEQTIQFAATSGRTTQDWSLEGEHRKTPFRASGLTTVRHMGRGKSARRMEWHTLVIEAKVPLPFAGRVVLAKDRGRLVNRLAEWLDIPASTEGNVHRIVFPHEGLERLFEIYAMDAEEAARLITPTLADSLVALDAAQPGTVMHAVFDSGWFRMALRLQRPLFSQPSLFTPMAGIVEHMQEIIREMSVPHRVIDYLHGDRPRPLL